MGQSLFEPAKSRNLKFILMFSLLVGCTMTPFGASRDQPFYESVDGRSIDVPDARRCGPWAVPQKLGCHPVCENGKWRSRCPVPSDTVLGGSCEAREKPRPKAGCASICDGGRWRVTCAGVKALPEKACPVRDMPVIRVGCALLCIDGQWRKKCM